MTIPMNMYSLPQRNFTIIFSFLGLFLFTALISLMLDYVWLYPVAITSLIGGIILLFKKPLWLLFGLIIVRMSLDYFGETLSLPLTETLSVTLSQLIGLGVAALGLLLMLLRPMAFRSLTQAWPLLLVFLWGITTLLWSLDSNATVRELLRVFDILVLFALAHTTIQSKEQFQKLLLAFFVSSIIPVLAGLYQFVMGIGFSDDAVDIPRIFGTMSHPNVYSLYLFSLIVLTTLYYTLFAKSSQTKFFTLILGLSYIVMLILTYTRVAWVLLFVFLFVIGIMRFRVLLLPLVLAPLMLYFFALPFQERVDSIFQSTPDSSMAWRQNLWSATVNKTLNEGRVLSGYGLNTFFPVSERLYEPSIGSNEAHNDFVKFFVEGGLIGLTIYILYLIGITVPLFKKSLEIGNWKLEIGTASLILFAFSLALALGSLSDNIFKNTPVQWIFWITLGASLAVFAHEKKKDRAVSHHP